MEEINLNPPLDGPSGPAAEISQIGRYLAVAQQIKDTLTILGLNFAWLFGLLFYGLPIPGFVLYVLRWRLARGRGSRQRAAVLWGLTLAHELLCILLFQTKEIQSEMHEVATWVSYGYALGALLSLGGLLATTTSAPAASADPQ